MKIKVIYKDEHKEPKEFDIPEEVKLLRLKDFEILKEIIIDLETGEQK